MTRREALRCATAFVALHLRGQSRPETFRVYTESPRLLLRPQKLRLLKRERERRSLRWDQFETLWSASAPFPELPWVQAMRFQVADDRQAGTRAVAWAVGPADATRPEELRQMAIVADWCESLISGDDKRQLLTKLERAVTDQRAVRTMAEARSRLFAAVVLSEDRANVSQKAIEAIYDGFWNGTLIASLRSAKSSVPNADAYAMLEILHVVRDNLNFDLRDTFPAWFRQYPLVHLLAHYPAPWPGDENEFRIPADETIQSSGPDVRKAALSRAAELAMVAYDANAASSQLLQGWVTNDKFLLRGPYGIPYEFLWANPYQPGLSYYHVPLVLHDDIGGQLFVRSSWEDDASWAGFFGGQLQLFKDGEVTRVDPAAAREPLNLETAIVLFGRAANKFTVPEPPPSPSPQDEPENGMAVFGISVFIVGLEPKRGYHVEIDAEEMTEEFADPGGIVYLPSVPAGGVRLGPAPVS